MTFKELCRIPGRQGVFEVLFRDGRLESLRPLDGANIDDINLWLTPGLFDIQMNGMLGHDLSEEDLDIEKIAAIAIMTTHTAMITL